MINKTDNEKWRQIIFDNWDTMQRRYAVSNQGQVASYQKNVYTDGEILHGSEIEGYRVIRLRVKGKYVAFLFHRLVAAYFLKKPKKGQEQIIHLNYQKKDNQYENLAWASRQEVAEHNKKSPAVIAYRKKISEGSPNIKKGLKLTIAQVKQIKKMLNSANRKLTYKQISQKYRISEMAVTRIKRGENWGWVTAD